MKTTRDLAIEINALFAQLLPDPQVINAGSAEHSGDADFLNVGLEKIVANLQALIAARTPLVR